jgi:hypothetical protein
MSFPDRVKEDALLASGRHCCLCHKYCGLKIELHHIKPKAEGGHDTFENCIPLCFDCHADMRSYDHLHPKGTKFSERELTRHRDNWYAKVTTSLPVTMTVAHMELDKQNLHKLREILHWNGVIRFVRDHHFGAPFYYQDIEDLFRFIWQCEDPAFEFFDADLESAKATLLEAIQIFTRHIGMSIWAKEHRPEMMEIPAKYEMNEVLWEHTVEKINQDTTKIAERYDALIRLARRKLAVML